MTLAHCEICHLFLRPTDACLHMAAFTASAPLQPSLNTGEQGRNALASGAPAFLSLHASEVAHD